MDSQQARNDLEQAQRSYGDSVLPPLPRWVPPVCGLLLAGAIALAGLGPASIWWRLAAIAGGVLLAVLAWTVVKGVRARQGIRGIRGPARRTVATLATSAVAYFVCVLNATPETRWLFFALGAATGVITWVMLRKKVRP
jgi:hypothetical protein